MVLCESMLLSCGNGVVQFSRAGSSRGRAAASLRTSGAGRVHWNGCGGPRGGVIVKMSAAASDGEGPTAAVTKGAADDIKTVSVRIKGKVQGVFYRNWTVESAKQLGVNGWVRNCKDGSVEAVFSGKPTSVDTLIDKCHGGPSAARVSRVEVSACNDAIPQGFERKPTIW